MPDDKLNEKIEKEPELFKVNEVTAGPEGRQSAEQEKAPVRVETGYEQVTEGESARSEGKDEAERAQMPSPVPAIGATPADQARIRQIENILAEGLEEIYVNMPQAKQREFKLAGEKTAVEINKLLSETKVKINKIVSLIIKWLTIIPGVNRFFLEQEAKIKADEIVKMGRS